MYEVGKVYIWQNKKGVLSALNGQETTVLSGRVMAVSFIDGRRSLCWPTDTMWEFSAVAADAGQLRPKNPPSGERLVRDLFEPKPVMAPA